MSHVFRQDYVRRPFRSLRVPLRRLPGVRLLSVMELVVLVLDPVELEKVNGQQDDAQEKHEADDQRHGKPSEPHPAATTTASRDRRAEAAKARTAAKHVKIKKSARCRRAASVNCNWWSAYRILYTSATSYGPTGYRHPHLCP